MQMTDSFGAAVAVTIPILALAAGAEARTIRERIQRPHEQWEKLYREHRLQHPLDPGSSAGEVLDHLLELPKLPVLFRVERAMAVVGAVVWLIVFSVLTVVELLTLLWLADGEPRGHGALAAFALVSIGVGFLALIVAPMAYLAMPVLLAFDLIPAGLRANLTARAAGGEDSRQIAKEIARETGGAFSRLTDRLAEENPAKHTVNVGPGKFIGLLKQELAQSRNPRPTEPAADQPLGSDQPLDPDPERTDDPA